jgi:hypothetical protein
MSGEAGLDAPQAASSTQATHATKTFRILNRNLTLCDGHDKVQWAEVRLKADTTPAVRLKADTTPAVRLKADAT